jgi:hypothetical protein
MGRRAFRGICSGGPRCWPGIFARWPAIEVGTLHAKGGGPLVSAATVAGENPISVRVSGGHGVLVVCESSGCVHCQLARCAIARARFNSVRPSAAATSRPPRHQPSERPLLVRVKEAGIALDGVSRDQGPLAGVKAPHSASGGACARVMMIALLVEAKADDGPHVSVRGKPLHLVSRCLEGYPVDSRGSVILFGQRVCHAQCFHLAILQTWPHYVTNATSARPIFTA